MGREGEERKAMERKEKEYCGEKRDTEIRKNARKRFVQTTPSPPKPNKESAACE